MRKTIEISSRKIKEADIVVGIPSLNEGDNIAFVVKQIDKGLQKFFPEYRSVIVNVDNFSSDNTKKEFLKTKTYNSKVYISTPKGVKGKGNNFYNLFEKALKWKALGVAVFDADLRSIQPLWVKEMLTPILEKNFDYTTPYYARSEYDGSITNHICYPLIKGLLGVDLRQPIGGDFALSIRLVEACMQAHWYPSTFHYGVDIFLTLNAILGNFAIAQVGLGSKIHKPSAPKLGPMFSQVVATLFENLHTHREKWMRETREEKLAYFGKKNLKKAQTLGIDYKGMKAKALDGFAKKKNILREILSEETFSQIEKMYGEEKIHLSSQLWYEAVFDALYAFGKSEGIRKTQIVEALKPLYFGRFTYFFRETLEKASPLCEKEIQNQAKFFAKHRNYFLKKYTKTKKSIVA